MRCGGATAVRHCAGSRTRSLSNPGVRAAGTGRAARGRHYGLAACAALALPSLHVGGDLSEVRAQERRLQHYMQQRAELQQQLADLRQMHARLSVPGALKSVVAGGTMLLNTAPPAAAGTSGPSAATASFAAHLLPGSNGFRRFKMRYVLIHADSKQQACWM